MVCSNGHVKMAKFLRKEFGYDFVNFKGDEQKGPFGDHQNCLHLAVKKNQLKMTKFLLSEASDKEKSYLLNHQTRENLESPIFYALNSSMQKESNYQSRLSMVKTLLSQTKYLDLGVQNKFGSTSFEAHADGIGFDELAQMAETAYLE